MPDHFLTLSAQAGNLHASLLSNIGLKGAQVQWLAHETAAVFRLETNVLETIEAALADEPVDTLASEQPPTPKALFLADMDSTMIEIECIDELADYAGVKAEVSQVTEQAMRGELDFREALAARVRLLEGLPVSVLEDCYQERVRFTEGAKTAVQTMAANGCRCVLVSGGFTFFTERVAAALGFHRHRANQLSIDKGHLTGEVIPPISDADTKLDTLKEERAQLSIDTNSVMAVGDGANDIPMIEAAGLGVAYRAKPKTRSAAVAAIDHSDLTALLHFQGIATP